jgi:hypothetical protein
MTSLHNSPLGTIATRIQARLAPPIFLPLLAVALLTTWYGLGPSLDRFAALSGGLRFVDMQPALTVPALLEQVRGYSPEAARYYLGWSLFDVAWPFVTYTTMLFITAWLLRRAGPAWERRFPLFVAVAYATVLLDWAENAGFVALVLAAPEAPSGVAPLAVLCHRGKLLFNLLFNLGFLVALLTALTVRLRNTRL